MPAVIQPILWSDVPEITSTSGEEFIPILKKQPSNDTEWRRIRSRFILPNEEDTWTPKRNSSGQPWNISGENGWYCRITNNMIYITCFFMVYAVHSPGIAGVSIVGLPKTPMKMNQVLSAYSYSGKTVNCYLDGNYNMIVLNIDPFIPSGQYSQFMISGVYIIEA